MRTFGRMRLVEPGEPWDRDLGVEPLSSGFTQDGFAAMLSGRTTPVKAFLLDQRRIAGIGNIYACEALWEARIRPGRPAKALTKAAIAGYTSRSWTFSPARPTCAERASTTTWTPRALRADFKTRSRSTADSAFPARDAANRSFGPCSRNAAPGGAGRASGSVRKNQICKVGTVTSLRLKSLPSNSRKRTNSRSSSASTRNRSKFSTRVRSSRA